jgi:hypothetical protein
MEALDDSRNCQTLGVSPAELGAYELLVKLTKLPIESGKFLSLFRRWCINGKNMAIFIKTLIAK